MTRESDDLRPALLAPRRELGYKTGMAAQLDEFRDRLVALFEGGGRYQVEKLMTIGVYLVIVIATLVWVVSVEDASNELGASHGFETLDPLNQKIFFLENESGDDWTDVRIVLNKDYLFSTDKVADGERLMLHPQDFRYFYWVPRPWGRNDWESVSPPPKPPRTAGEDLQWNLIEVRARQGRLDLDLSRQN